MQVVPLIINGKTVYTTTQLPVVNPPSGEEIWTTSSASVEDAANAVRAAEDAFASWSKTKPSIRRDIFLKAADILESRTVELKRLMKQETGAEDGFIDFNISCTIGNLKDLAGRISSIQGFYPTSEAEGRSAIVSKEPYGVVLGIAPW